MGVSICLKFVITKSHRRNQSLKNKQKQKDKHKHNYLASNLIFFHKPQNPKSDTKMSGEKEIKGSGVSALLLCGSLVAIASIGIYFHNDKILEESAVKIQPYLQSISKNEPKAEPVVEQEVAAPEVAAPELVEPEIVEPAAEPVTEPEVVEAPVVEEAAAPIVEEAAPVVEEEVAAPIVEELAPVVEEEAVPVVETVEASAPIEEEVAVEEPVEDEAAAPVEEEVVDEAVEFVAGESLEEFAEDIFGTEELPEEAIEEVEPEIVVDEPEAPEAPEALPLVDEHVELPEEELVEEESKLPVVEVEEEVPVVEVEAEVPVVPEVVEGVEDEA